MDRITYFKTTSPYPNDFTKFCSLNGIEIDNNFLTLEGRDVKSLTVEGEWLILTLYNGSQIKCKITTIYSGYTAGEGIDKELLENQKIIETNAFLIKITNDIEVKGGEIGSYSSGDVIPAGTSIEDILKNILNKTCNVEAYPPLSQVGVSLVGDTFEVGSIHEDFRVKVDSYNSAISNSDWGTFKGLDDWSIYTLNAGCAPISTQYYVNNNPIGEPTANLTPIRYSFNDTTNILTEGKYEFGCRVTYGESSAIPKKSDGTDSDVKIPAGITPFTSETIFAAYKYYYGYVQCEPWAVYDEIITSQSDLTTLGFLSGFCNINENTTIKAMTSSDVKSSLVLVLPAKYRNIKLTENKFGAKINLKERWKQQTKVNAQTGEREPLTLQYTVGVVTTTYYVYILHSLYGIEYNNITFGNI